MKPAIGISVVPRRAKPGPRKLRITQGDLAEELMLHRIAKQAVRAWKDKRSYIRELLEAGAKIDKGIRVAALRTTKILTTG
jgi:hypothetical protein